MAIVKTQNWEGGSNARYDVSKMTAEERQNFDSEGRPLIGGVPGDGPGQWTDGLPGARGGSGPNDGGGGGGAGGMSPDAYFNQIKSMLQAQAQAEAAGTKSQLQKLLIGFGMVPEGFDDKLGVLDDLTKDLIAKNTSSGISQYARLLEAKGDNTKALIGRLSHTGLRRSGAKGAKLRKGQLDYDRLISDSLQEVLSQISGAYGNMATNEQARQMQLLQALQGSQGNYWSGAGSTVTKQANPYVFTADQRGSTAGGGTQTSLAKFVTGLGLPTGGSGGSSTPVYSGGGSLTHRAQ